MKKRIVFIGVLASSLLALTGCGKTTVDANEYLQLDVSGYNTVGTASWNFDAEQFIMDNSSAFGVSDTSEMEYLSAIVNVEEYLNGELDKEDNLSNGDVVTFKWNSSNVDKLEEKYNINIKAEDKTIDVSSLEEPKEIDLFEYVNVTFDGVAPNGNVNIDIADDIPINVSFSADKLDNLSNGDVIKIVAKSSGKDDVKDYCFQNGYIPKEVEKEYTVEGLVSYVSSIDQISDEMIDKMQSQALASINSYGASWESDSHGDDIKKMGTPEFLGYYFLSGKEGFSTSPYNEIYLVYKVTNTMNALKRGGDGSTKVEDKETYYTFYRYSDITLLEDGTCSADLSTGTMTDHSSDSDYGYNDWFAVFYKFMGYPDLDSMFNECVTQKLEQYDYESTVK